AGGRTWHAAAVRRPPCGPTPVPSRATSYRSVLAARRSACARSWPASDRSFLAVRRAALDRAEHDAGDEVLLQERVEADDGKSGQDHRDRLDVGGDLREPFRSRAPADRRRIGGPGDEEIGRASCRERV